MFMIASDGACQGSTGTAAWGIACSNGDYDMGHEYESTNQRGELLGCLAALEYAKVVFENEDEEDVAIIFDSAYIANCLKNKWYGKWLRNGWYTSTGEKVKNIDLWQKIVTVAQSIPDDNLHIYQIKGHTTLKGPKSMEKCRASFEKNNGILPPEEILVELIKLNNLADAYAGQAKEEAIQLAPKEL